ncbi:MAG: hypothetical protein ACI9R3_004588 [Verrucomicrobiales bacterium]|jgi:hypothetical protein
MKTKEFYAAATITLLAMAGSAVALPPVTISEPDTILFGRIVNRAGAAEEFVSDGMLTWSFQLPDGSEKTLTTRLESLHDGRYSYRLKMPHSLVAAGLRPTPQSLPLALDPRSFGFAEILVNGAKAVVENGEISGVTVSQSQRASAVRIDLELQEPMIDSDGDGMPDWWEQKYGLDPESAGDSRLDLDGDGLSNGEEYLAGLSPEEDNRQPGFAQKKFTIYPAGRSGLALRVVDSDTAPEDIVAMVTELPAVGQLVVRDGEGGRILRTGDWFTAADAALGLFEYRHSAESGTLPPHVSVGISLSDSTHAPAVETLQLSLYIPQLEDSDIPDWEKLADTSYLVPGEPVSTSLRNKSAMLASNGASVVWDLIDSYTDVSVQAVSGSATAESYAANQMSLYGAEPPTVLLGGHGDDTLAGGLENDILYGGAGHDKLTGNRGADRFVINVHSGSDEVLDFNPSEGDQIDLTRVIQGTSMVLEDYVSVTVDEQGRPALEIVPSGIPEQAATVSVRLNDYSLTADSLAGLVQSGAILVGNLSAMPMLSIERVTDSGENGLVAGRFVLRRAGSVRGSLTVKLAVSGSATSGIDYQSIGSSVTFPSDEREMSIDILPYGDGIDESSETVRIEILSSEGYKIANSGSSAELLIQDLEPLMNFDVLSRVVSMSPQSSGLLMLNREGLLDRQIVVRLQWTGAAALAVVEPLPEFLELGRGETSRLIEIKPRVGVTVPAQSLTLSVKLLDGSYLLSSRSEAQIAVVPAIMSFGSWLAANALNDSSQEVTKLAQTDPGQRGVSLLSRFAFGLASRHPEMRSESLPQVRIRDGRPGLEFVLDPAATGVQVKVETSIDIDSWETGSTLLREAPRQGMPAGWRRYEATEADAVTSRFFRVDLQLEP